MTIPILQENKPKTKKPRKKLSVEHKNMVWDFILLVWDTEMEQMLKLVAIWKMWGIDPTAYFPLTYEQIAAMPEVRATPEIVRMMHEEAKFHAKQHLKRVSMADVYGRFYSKESNKYELFKPGGKIIKP